MYWVVRYSCDHVISKSKPTGTGTIPEMPNPRKSKKLMVPRPIQTHQWGLVTALVRRALGPLFCAFTLEYDDAWVRVVAGHKDGATAYRGQLARAEMFTFPRANIYPEYVICMIILAALDVVTQIRMVCAVRKQRMQKAFPKPGIPYWRISVCPSCPIPSSMTLSLKSASRVRHTTTPCSV